MKTDAEPVEIGSISREIYVSAGDLAALLKISDNEISRLARSRVLSRVAHPEDSRAFLYPLLENVTAYVTHLRSAREKAYLAYIQEKARLGKVQRMRTELKHALENGTMVSKEDAFATLSTGLIAFKQALLSRGERLEAMLGQLRNREARVEAIRADDARFLGMLADSLKAADIGTNGQASS